MQFYAIFRPQNCKNSTASGGYTTDPLNFISHLAPYYKFALPVFRIATDNKMYVFHAANICSNCTEKTDKHSIISSIVSCMHTENGIA